MATLPVLLTNGTTADADDVMDDFNEIYSNIDATNVAAGNRTGTAGGKFVLQTSATIITPTIQGTISLTTTPAFTGTMNLWSGCDLNLYSDAGTTKVFTVDAATGNVGIAAATARIYLDGVALTGDTYITESTPNNVLFQVGGAASLQLTATNATFVGDILVQSTKKVFVDNGVDTYLWEQAANTVAFVCGGTDSLTIRAASIAVNATDRVYLDGRAATGNTFIYESSADNMALVAGGTTQLQLTATNATFNGNVLLQTATNLYLDGGGDTYLRENAANTLQVVVGGAASITLTATAATFIGDVSIPATKKLYLDGGTDTYFDENSDGSIRIITNSSVCARFTSSEIYMIDHGTTASAANAVLTAITGELQRSTSSIKYKEKVRDLETNTANIYNLRPVTYADKKTHVDGYIGLIAEEVDLFIPELVQHTPDGGCEYVTYDRLSVLLLAEMKKLKTRLDSLEG